MRSARLSLGLLALCAAFAAHADFKRSYAEGLDASRAGDWATVRQKMQEALAEDVGEELLPGAAVQSDEAILDNFRELSTSGLHGVGTCRMGREGESVLDPALRVHGIGGLRVADCSAMPGLVTGNTNAPAMALGWRAADLVLGG